MLHQPTSKSKWVGEADRRVTCLKLPKKNTWINQANLFSYTCIQLKTLIYWSFCSMFPQLSMKYEGVSTGIKYFVRNHIISLHSSICPWNMSLFISPELPLFYISKMRFEVIYNFIWLSEFLFPSNKTFLLFCTKSFFFWTGSCRRCNFLAKLYEKDIFSIRSLKEMDEVRLMKAF